MTNKLTVVCISDTHSMHRQLVMPPGDILIHAGDWTDFGTQINHARDFIDWLAELPYRHKIIVAGNHDQLMESKPQRDKALAEFQRHGIIYLEDQGITLEGMKFWGTPWQPAYGGLAFNLYEERDLAEKCALIPDDTEILISHGPPYGHCDLVYETGPTRTGSYSLRQRIAQLANLKLVVCGHIHEGYGIDFDDMGRKIVNAALGGLKVGIDLKPIVIEFKHLRQGIKHSYPSAK